MIGLRCRRTEDYYKTNVYSWRKYRLRWGTIIGEVFKYNRNYWCIIWDGTKTKQLVGKDNVVLENIPTPINLEQISKQLTELNNFYVTHTKTIHETDPSPTFRRNQ